MSHKKEQLSKELPGSEIVKNIESLYSPQPNAFNPYLKNMMKKPSGKIGSNKIDLENQS